MKRVFALLLCLILAMVTLASCVGTGSQGGDGHTHTFETEWSKDSEGHWYEATCDCEDLEPSKLAHVDANNDGACDLCTFTDHTHEYETETWTVNCTQHWHAATCGHVVVGIDAADHADENADGKCDTCNYVIEDIHQHVYDDEWSSDENNHWHAALCEHKVEVADSEPHTIDAAGYCTVCEAKVREIDKADFLAVLTAAMARNHKVVDASIIANQTVYGGSAGNYKVESYLSNEVYFVLGNGYSYIFDKTFDQSGFVGADEYWFEQTGEDSVFGVSKRFGDYKLTPSSGEMQFLNGYNYIPGSILPNANDDTSTLANLIYLLYGRAIATDGLSANAKESYNAETGVYSFSFTCYNINITPSSMSGEILVEVELFNAAVEFTVDDNLVIDNAKISVEVYRDFEADSDLTYTVSTDEEGNTVVSDIQLKATANPSFYDYVVSQRSGERTFTTPYPRASLIPQDFNFSLVTKYEFDEWSQYVILEETPVVDSLTVTEGAYLNLHVGDPYPMTASFDFMTSGDFTYSFVNKDPNSTAKAWNVNDTFLNGYSSYNNCLKIKILEPGEYVVTITFGDVSKVFDLTVEGEQAPDIGEDDANTVNVVVTDTYGFFDLYSYTATEAGTYTFTLPANLALYSKARYDSYSAPEVDLYDNAEGGATVEVTLNAGEKYEFYVGSINKGAYAIGVSFVAGEVGGDTPGGDDNVDDEKYHTVTVVGINTLYFSSSEIAADSASRAFTATADGKYKFASGNLFVASVVDANGNTIAKNDDYTYTLTAGEYTLNFSMLSMFGVAADVACTLNVTVTSSDDGGNTPGGDEGGEDDNNALKDTLAGVWFTVEGVGEGMFFYDYENSMYLLNVFGEGYDLYFTYTITDNGDGSYTFTPAYYARPDIETFNQDMCDAVVAAEIVGSYDGTEWTFGDEGDDEGGEGGDTESDPVKDSLGGFYTVLDFDLYFFFNSGENVYFMNAYGNGYDLYFTYTVNDNGDGTYSIVPEYCSRPDVESGDQSHIDAILATEFIASYDGFEWTFIYEGSDEPNGSTERPYPITSEETVCAFPGGYSPIWYQATAMLGGYVTVSSSTPNAYLQLGIDPNSAANNILGYDEDWNTIYGDSVTFYIPAGYTYYVGISEGNEEAAEITFTVNFTPFYSDDYTSLIGTWTGSADQFGTVTNFTLVIDQYATGSYKEDDGYWKNEYTVEYLILDGTTLILGLKNEYASIVYTMTYADGVITYQADEYSPVVTFTPGTPDVGGDEGDTPEISYETVVTEGENTLYFSSSEIAANSANRVFTATADGNYKFASGNLFIASVVDANGNIIAKNDDYTYTLTAGEYTLNFGMLSMFGVAADTACTLNVTVTTSDEGGEDVGGDTPAEGSGSGTQNDPWVITTLPITITHGAGHDVYYTYTATEDVTIVISYPAGCYISTSAPFEKDAAALTYTLTVSAGDVVSINPWTSGVNEEYTYTFEIVAPSEGGENEGGEDVGGEGAAVTYIAENANGRKMMVVIDAAAGTMTVTRSDMTGNFSGGATTANFTYSFADGVVTYAVIGTSSVTSITFDENGAPVSVVWMGVSYEGYVQQ